MQNIIGLILAGGKDERMNSNKNKLVQKIYGKEIVLRAVETLEKTGIEEIAVVVGYKKEEIIETLKDRVKYIEQDEVLGSGHALITAKEYFSGRDGNIIVLNADVPLLESKSIERLLQRKEENNEVATIITAIHNTPSEYGRVIRDELGNLKKIVENYDLDKEKSNIKEINAGIYCFDIKTMTAAIEELKPNSNSNMYNITDIIEILVNKDLKVGAEIIEDSTEVLAVNDRIQLEILTKILRMKINAKHMKNGVTIEDTNTTYIYEDVKIGKDTIIHPNTTIKNNVEIGENCEIGPNSNIRENCNVADNVKIGSFVELKKSDIGQYTKIPHLSYIGDSVIGENCNIGCGTITCNYDGFRKSKTIIGNNVFIGSNVNLVAPLEIKNNVFIAAGSTITENVPESSLAIARERQINKENWNRNK